MTRSDRRGFVHRLPVRLHTLDGKRGTLLRCERRADGGVYWKVLIRAEDGGGWAWPDSIIVDGDGDRICPKCLECGLPFVGVAGDLLCAHCQRSMFGREFAPPEAFAQDTRERRGPYRRRRRSAG